jgi:hypothetical protein
MIKVCVILPVQNDYKSALKLIRGLNLAFPKNDFALKFIIIDDGSNWREINKFERNKLSQVTLIKSDAKFGHQKSIFLGLEAANARCSNSYIIVMDADGEDKPLDAKKLFDFLFKNKSTDAVLAARGSRQVAFSFIFFYKIYQFIFKILTGETMNSGNFFALRPYVVRNILNIPRVNLNPSATIKRFSANVEFIRINRGRRFFGKSRMNFTKLLLHALSTLAIYSDLLLARMLVLVLSIFLLTGFTTLLLITAKVFNLLNLISGWTSLFLLQITGTLLILFFILFLGIILNFRNNSQ